LLDLLSVMSKYAMKDLYTEFIGTLEMDRNQFARLEGELLQKASGVH